MLRGSGAAALELGVAATASARAVHGVSADGGVAGEREFEGWEAAGARGERVGGVERGRVLGAARFARFAARRYPYCGACNVILQHESRTRPRRHTRRT